jgi:hypothetical protein
MPWKECSVMDERLQFVGRRLAGESMAELCGSSGFRAKLATRSSIATRNAGFTDSRTEAGVPIVTPTNFRFRSRTTF